MTGASTLRNSLRLLATPRFGTFWFASLLSSIGTWAQQVAEPWLLLTLGASSFVVGLDSFAMNAPVLVLTLVGGALADRADRRRVIALFQSIQLLCPTLIVVLLLTHRLQPWMVVALSVVVGVTDALSMPSFQSIVSGIVSRDQLERALALNATQFNLSRILGPSIAGVLMATVGGVACFVVSALSYLPFIGVALWILPARLPLPRPARRARLAGLGEVLRQRHVLGPLLLVLVTGTLCAPLVTFSPVLVKDVFQGTATRFSVAMGSFGVGGLLGATALLAFKPRLDRRRLSVFAALVYGLVVVLTALNPWFWGLPVLLVLAGAAMTVSNTAASALLQGGAGPMRLGITVSLFLLALRGGLSLGSLLTGATIGVLGVQRALLADGVLALALHTAVARYWLQGEAPTDGALAATAVTPNQPRSQP